MHDLLDYIIPACLPTPDLVAKEGDLVTPIGWGRPSDCNILKIIIDEIVNSNDFMKLLAVSALS